MKKEEINQNSWNNIAKSLLNKGMDIDKAIDWMEERFVKVEDEIIINKNLKIAIEKGFITEA